MINNTPPTKIVADPGYITFQLPGHDYTATVSRLASLSEWVRAHQDQIEMMRIDYSGDFGPGELEWAVRGAMPEPSHKWTFRGERWIYGTDLWGRRGKQRWYDMKTPYIKEQA